MTQIINTVKNYELSIKHYPPGDINNPIDFNNPTYSVVNYYSIISYEYETYDFSPTVSVDYGLLRITFNDTSSLTYIGGNNSYNAYRINQILITESFLMILDYTYLMEVFKLPSGK
jgi:hypothetical protein